MQLAVLNFLLGFPGAAVTSGQGGDTGAPDLFSQMLGDTAGEGAGQSPLPKGGEMFADVAPGALLAQEVSAADDTDAADAVQLSDLLNNEVTPETASNLLANFDSLGNALGIQNQEMLDQLKSSLQHIKDSGKPQTLGALVAQLPAVSHGASERSQAAIEKMLAWVKSTLKTTNEQDSPTQDATTAEDTIPSAITQSLQASMFRAANSTSASTEEADTSADDSAQIDPSTLTTFVPTSAQLTAQAPAWVQNIGAVAPTAPRADLDSAIPPLAMNEPQAQDTQESVNLPAVNLPGDNVAMTKAKTAVVMDRLKPFSEHLSPTDKALDDTAISTADDVTGTPQILPQTHGTLTDHRALTVSTPHSPLNHAPVAEQVHVAIKNGMKDGIDQMTIQLDPVDLGRVEVSMRTGSDGQTQLSFIVDKAETLDALARDARSLEKSLQEAGVKADTGSMQFNLRQQPQPQSNNGDGQSQRHAFRGEDDDVAAIAPQASAISAIRNYSLTLQDGVDIRA